VFVDALRDPPTGAPGDLALLEDKSGKILAQGYVDPTTPLAFRVCAQGPGARADDPWAEAALERAVQLRERLFSGEDTTGYRVVHGEGDGLPGLVFDRYADVGVLRLDGPAAEGFWNAAGIARWMEQRLGLSAVYERHRSRGGAEGGPLVGATPDAPILFRENGLSLTSDVVNGQKTGFFLDQRDNRDTVRRIAHGRVLNVFGYTGGFSVAAMAGGAEHVTTVDVARPALAVADAHLRAAGVADEAHEEVAEDAFDYLDGAAERGEKWDVVVLDPPAFAPNQRAVAGAERAYERLISAGARVTAPGGFLACASCSSHISAERFVALVEEGVGTARRRGTVLDVGGVPADHPAPLGFRDFRYLVFVLIQLDG
jgi:23S rRNA (cytosine1962-C5)-methyltransferase